MTQASSGSGPGGSDADSAQIRSGKVTPLAPVHTNSYPDRVMESRVVVLESYSQAGVSGEGEPMEPT